MKRHAGRERFGDLTSGGRIFHAVNAVPFGVEGFPGGGLEQRHTDPARGIDGIVQRLAACIAAGQAEGSLPALADPKALAGSLYQTWFGATLLVKITRERAPLDAAMATTRQLLQVDSPTV